MNPTAPIRILVTGEHQDLEAAIRADGGEPLGHGLQGGGGAHRVLVVDRHHERGERAAGPPGRAAARSRAVRPRRSSSPAASS